jgi:sporulation protein YlmC with PRC-barrel domain/uncharacterized membrane protein
MTPVVTLFARVMCVDGITGELIAIVIHPETEEIINLVIKDKTVSEPNTRLVPIERVIVSTPRTLELDCTRKEISRMQLFIPEHYIEREFNPYGYAFNLPMMITPEWITSERPEQMHKKLKLHRGLVIEAVDERIGQAGEFLIDPHTKEISHIILKRRPLWRKEDIIIPVSRISQIEAEKILINLEKHAVETMTNPTLKRPWKEVFQSDLDLLMWTFTTKALADTALKTLRAYQENNHIFPVNLALIIRDMDGHITLREFKDTNAQMGASSSMVNSGLVNFLFSMDGSLDSLRHEIPSTNEPKQKVGIDIPKGMVKNFAEEIPCGGAAIVLIIEHRWYSLFRQVIARYDQIFFHKRLTDGATFDSPVPGSN